MTEICSAVLASHRQQTQSSAQFRVFDARSTSLSVPEHIPERVDLVVTEIFDAALFGEHCLSTLCHAWSCLLHNSPHRKSQVIPKGAELYVCAIECPEIRKENCVQQSSVPLLDLSGTHITSRTCAAGGDDPYTTEDLYSIRNSYRFLSPIHSLMTVDFNDPQNLEVLCSFSQDFILDVYAEGTVDALAVWFDLDLCEGVKVSTGPSEQCCWEQAIFPVVAVGSREEDKAADAGHPGSVKVNCGDQLKIHCTLNDGCLRLTVKDVVAFGYFLNSCHISPHLSDATEQVNGQLPQLSSSVTEKVGSHGFCQSSSTAKMGGDGSAFQLSNRTKKDVKGVFDSSSIAEEFTGSKVGLSDCVAQEVGVPSVCTVEEGDGSASQTVCSAEDFTKAFRGCDVDHVSEPKQTSCIVSRTVENSQGGSSTEQSKKAGLLTPVGQHADGAEMDCSDMEPCNDKHVSPNSDFASQELRCLNKPPLTANCADSKHRNHGSSHAENGEQDSTSSAGLLPPIGQLNGACVCSYSQVNGDVLSDNSRGAKRDASVCVNGARTGSCCESSKVSVPCESECSTQHVKSAKEKIVRGDSGLCMEMENDCKNQSPTTQSSCLGDADTWCVQNHNNNSNRGDNFEIKHHRHHDLYLQNNTQDTRPCTFHLQREEVRRLNDMKFNSLYVSALQHTQTHAGKPLTLLTISNSPPLHGLLALKSGFFKEAEFCYMGVSKTEEVKGLMEHVGSRNGVSRSGWKWNRGSVEDIVEGGRGGGGGGVPVVSLDMVETAGCLRAGVVNELRALRSAVSGNTVMIPQTVDVYAVLISSQQLQDMSCVTSDHNTLGVSIAPHINPFQTRTFLDLDIHALPHKNLSDVVHVFHMDIQSCVTPSAGPTEVLPPTSEFTPSKDPNTLCSSPDGSESVFSNVDSVFSQCRELRLTARRSGYATAVVFWFDQQLAPGVSASTVDPEMNWKQAAFLLNGREVSEGEEIMMNAHLEKTYVHFALG
ncbi:uncharacterized protein LOC143298817 isoform X2 [Babylonia areolata]